LKVLLATTFCGVPDWPLGLVFSLLKLFVRAPSALLLANRALRGTELEVFFTGAICMGAIFCLSLDDFRSKKLSSSETGWCRLNKSTSTLNLCFFDLAWVARGCLLLLSAQETPARFSTFFTTTSSL
jgi:hypothetical protein